MKRPPTKNIDRVALDEGLYAEIIPCDIIEHALQMVMEACPAFTEQHAAPLEQRLRLAWGGVPNTPAKRAPMLRKAREKVRAEIGLKSVDELHEECGVSRRTIYRWISK